MKKHLITGLFAALALTANAQSFKEWLDPEINAVNRAPMHTNYFAYESADAAMQGKKDQSTNYMTLNGTWKFSWRLALSVGGERRPASYRLLESRFQ